MHEGYDTPIWKTNPANPTGDSIKFSYAKDTSKELQLVYGSDTASVKDRQYRYSHPGWSPTQMTTYSMQWRDSYVAWWADTSAPSPDDPARLTFRTTKNTKDWPTKRERLRVRSAYCSIDMLYSTPNPSRHVGH